MNSHTEPLPELFTRATLLTLDFNNINPGTHAAYNIEHFFEQCQRNGKDPTLAEQRQSFNNSMLDATKSRYLVSQYGEDRAAMLAGSRIAKERRTIHLGVDVFCRDLEAVYSPCSGKIVQVGREPGGHSFGNYVIIKPDDADYFLFFGHMSAQQPRLGRVRAGQKIGTIGDYLDNENGGWSRHLHIQLFRTLPSNNDELIGYSSQPDFAHNQYLYPNPCEYWPELATVITNV